MLCDPYTSTLKEIIGHYTLIGNFITSNGTKTNLYFDIKGLLGDNTLNPRLDVAIWDYLQEHIIFDNFKSVGGLELGGALMVCTFIFSDKVCFIRKSERKHGLMKMIEGLPESPILLMDDVIKSARTMFNGVKVCRDSGYEVNDFFCVIDRLDDDLRKQLEKTLHLKIHSLFKESDFLNV